MQFLCYLSSPGRIKLNREAKGSFFRRSFAGCGTGPGALYIRSGAETPRRAKPLASTWRKQVTNVKRAWVSSG